MEPREAVHAAERLLERLLRLLTPGAWWYPREEIGPEAFRQLLRQVVSPAGAGLACKHLHAHSCAVNTVLRGFRMLLRVYKTYALIHLVPHLLFKKDRFSPKALRRLAANILRTLVFFQAYASIGMFNYCTVSLVSGRVNFLVPMLHAPVSAATIFIERSHRWPEFAMNVFPKYLESLEPFLQARQLWLAAPLGLGRHLLLALAMGAVASVYHSDPGAVKQTFRWLVAALMGPPPAEADADPAPAKPQ